MQFYDYNSKIIQCLALNASASICQVVLSLNRFWEAKYFDFCMTSAPTLFPNLTSVFLYDNSTWDKVYNQQVEYVMGMDISVLAQQWCLWLLLFRQHSARGQERHTQRERKYIQSHGEPIRKKKKRKKKEEEKWTAAPWIQALIDSLC